LSPPLQKFGKLWLIVITIHFIVILNLDFSSYSDHEGVAAVVRIQKDVDQESGQAAPYQVF
jgi:hypothetical protein